MMVMRITVTVVTLVMPMAVGAVMAVMLCMRVKINAAN